MLVAQVKGSKDRRIESADGAGTAFGALVVVVDVAVEEVAAPGVGDVVLVGLRRPVPAGFELGLAVQIGRASCREGVSVTLMSVASWARGATRFQRTGMMD